METKRDKRTLEDVLDVVVGMIHDCEKESKDEPVVLDPEEWYQFSDLMDEDIEMIKELGKSDIPKEPTLEKVYVQNALLIRMLWFLGRKLKELEKKDQEDVSPLCPNPGTRPYPWPTEPWPVPSSPSIPSSPYPYSPIVWYGDYQLDPSSPVTSGADYCNRRTYSDTAGNRWNYVQPTTRYGTTSTYTVGGK